MNQCNCEFPVIIINKKLPYIVMDRIEQLTYLPMPSLLLDLDASLRRMRSTISFQEIYDHIYNYLSTAFSYVRHTTFKKDPETQKKVRVRSPFIDIIEQSDTFTFLDTETGEVIDIFQLCECGHCHVCSESKRVSWSVRCQLECQSHNILPYFITLTYNNKSLPKDGELHKEDLDLFIHRFRKNLIYKFQYDVPFRVLKCGEYGRLKGRPHFHILVWFDKHLVDPDLLKNRETSDRLELKYLSEIVKLSWSYQFYCGKDPFRVPRGFHFIEQCSNSKAGYYLGKYLSKYNVDSNPHMCNKKVKPFLVGTRKGGAIGKPFLMSLQGRFLSLSPGQDLLYNDIHKTLDSLTAVPLTKWVLNTLVPTMARQLKKGVRDMYRQYTYSLKCVLAYGKKDENMWQFIKKHDFSVITLYGQKTNFAFRSPSPLNENDIFNLVGFLDNTHKFFYRYGFDIMRCNNIAEFRDKYLAFQVHNPVPIADKRDKIIRHNQVEFMLHPNNDMQ